MIKKVKTEQLRPGIFIHNFGEKWMNHPFMTNTKRVASEWHIERIREYNIQEIYIDTNRGLDVLSEPVSLQEWSSAFGNKKAKEKLLLKRDVWIPFKKELEKAVEVRNKAHNFVKALMEDIKMGRDFNVDAASEIVDETIDSLTRNKDAILSLVSIQNKDEYTFNHSVNVCILTAVFCKFLEMSNDDIKKYSTGALFHDLGKTKIPIEIITKPTKLSPEEFQSMKQHPTFGKEILENIKKLDSKILDIVYEHHERMSGTGYPNGLSGEQISLGGRLASIVDVYDALTSDRSYRDGDPPKKALSLMFKLAPSEFDPELLQKFIQSIGIYPVGSLVRLKSGFLAIVVESAREELKSPVVLIVYDSKRNRSVVPRKLDLSAPGGTLHQIIDTESAAKWNIDIVKYMQGKSVENEQQQ